jgi:hypothetical protein
MDELSFYFKGYEKFRLSKDEIETLDPKWEPNYEVRDEKNRPHCIMALVSTDLLILEESMGYCEKDILVIKEECKKIGEATTIEEVTKVVDKSKYIYLK